jgi:hypothetical protein
MLAEMRGSGWALAVLLLLVASPSASADPASAERAFRHGKEEYARRNFAAAAASFEEAFHEDPRAVTIYNAGLARQIAGDSAHAADDYATALSMSDLTPEQAGDARTRLAALELSLGRVDVVAIGALVSVGTGDKLPSPAHVHLAAGAYEVLAAWPDGKTGTRSIDVIAGGQQIVTLEKPSAAAPPPQPLQAPAAPQSPPATPASSQRVLPEPLRAPSDAAPSRTFLYVSGAIGIVGLGLGVVAGSLTLGDKSTVDHHCGIDNVRTQCDPQGKSAADEARTTGLLSTVGFAAGGVGIATAVMLLITERPGSRTARGWEPLFGSDGTRGAFAGIRKTW